MTDSEFAFTDGTSGKIVFTLGYTASTGSANCIVAYNSISGAKTNTFFQFNTSTLPDDATVTVVNFGYIESTTQPPTSPSKMYVYIGDFIGAALNGNAGEFTGGTYMLDAVAGGWINNSGVYYDLAAEDNDPTGFVSLTGTTDVRFEHDTVAGTNGRNFNTAKLKCTLLVTYTQPTSFISRLALLGAGALLGFVPAFLTRLLTTTKTMEFEPL